MYYLLPLLHLHSITKHIERTARQKTSLQHCNEELKQNDSQIAINSFAWFNKITWLAYNWKFNEEGPLKVQLYNWSDHEQFRAYNAGASSFTLIYFSYYASLNTSASYLLHPWSRRVVSLSSGRPQITRNSSLLLALLLGWMVVWSTNLQIEKRRRKAGSGILYLHLQHNYPTTYTSTSCSRGKCKARYPIHFWVAVGSHVGSHYPKTCCSHLFAYFIYCVQKSIKIDRSSSTLFHPANQGHLDITSATDNWPDRASPSLSLSVMT